MRPPAPAQLLASAGLALALVAAASAAGARPAAAPPRGVNWVVSSYGKIVLLYGLGDAVRSFGRGESPAFSADASTIAFVRDGDVFTVGVDGKRLSRVTRTAAIEESPDWSPDGSLVYASNRSGRFGLYVQKPGGSPRRVTHPPQAWQEDRAPSWSPDGKWIAFSSNRPSNFNGELYRVRPTGRGLERLTFTPGSEEVLGDDGMPTWRPDGRSIVFVSNRDRNFELYELNLRTRATRRLTRTTVDEALPRISRDGRYAFVVPLTGGGSRISVMNAERRGRRVIQAGTGVDWRP
jgi:Tol biopolymer transport system component